MAEAVKNEGINDVDGRQRSFAGPHHPTSNLGWDSSDRGETVLGR